MIWSVFGPQFLAVRNSWTCPGTDRRLLQLEGIPSGNLGNSYIWDRENAGYYRVNQDCRFYTNENNHGTEHVNSFSLVVVG